MIITKEMTTVSQLKGFVKFPFSLFGENPYWVPPIISEEMEVFDHGKNPVFKNAEAHFFMAYRDHKPVGRIAAIINWLEVKDQQKPKVRFGWFDAVDDIDVTKALLAEVEKVGQKHGLTFMEGPVGFSNMDKAGMLVDGFEQLNTMITWYSMPYYHEHFEQLGFTKEKEWVEYKIHVPHMGPDDKVRRFAGLIMDRYGLKVLRFKNKSEIIRYADKIFELINDTYSGLSTYVPIQTDQVDYYKKKYFRYLQPEFINCVADKNGEIVAFAITMPSFTNALQRAHGRLLPFGWMHLARTLRAHTKADFYLIGIKPEYQNKGLTAIIFKEMTETFNRRGITEVETNPELEENKAIQALWNRYDSELHKRRRTYRKDFN